ncbi:MAG TPA: hypothetical protein VGF25_12580 [Thermoleophilaceae bacterium]
MRIRTVRSVAITHYARAAVHAFLDSYLEWALDHPGEAPGCATSCPS